MDILALSHHFKPSESPLLRLFQQRQEAGKSYIDAPQFAAGEKLRADYERAHMGQRVVSAYAQSAGSGGRHWQMSDNSVEKMNDGTLAARQRLHMAFAAVGPELSGILYQVCCVAAGFETAEAVLALPPRSGKAVLKLALTRLARHYGLIHAKTPKPKDTFAVWAMDDYRPSITQQPAHPL
jgi:Domain of unknown function (DUF6456)